jgi:hypothetical protein
MVTVKRIIFLLVLAGLTSSPVQSEEKQAAPMSNTRTANCLVKITCDPAILPLSLETIDYLLHSSGVGEKARREVLGISADQDYNLFTVEYVQSFASDDLGGVGLPLRASRAVRSGVEDYESAISGSNYDMIESNKGVGLYASSMVGTEDTEQVSSTGTSRRDRSSRGSRTRRYEPASGVSSDRRRRDRGGTLYEDFAAPGMTKQRGENVTADSIEEQTFLFRLNVHLPEDIKPMAKEFMKDLVDNLRASLNDAYKAYSRSLITLLEDTELRRDSARSRLAEVMKHVKVIEPPPVLDQSSSDISVYERLEQIIDLSNLEPTMAFADVLNELKNSVDPPLQIQPNWRDLLENADVEQTTPAGMDPQPNIKLRKALEILLAAVSSDLAKLKYVVDDGVILIGTQAALPSKMVMRVYNIPALAYSPGSTRGLIDAIQNTIDPESWFDMSDMGEATITPYPSQRPRKLAILQTYENHQKIWKFLQSITIDIPTGTPSDIPEKVLIDDRSSLFREKQNLEMELARLQGRTPAVEAQIRRIKDEIDEKVRGDQVSEELRKILDMQVKRLEGFKKLVDDGDINDGVADAEEKVARAKIELAKRREQIGISAGSDQLAKLNNELSTLAIDMAEKKAMLDVIKKQLDQTQQQLTAADISDPQVSRIRVAAQALEIAERRVNELNAKYVDLQIPIVSVLGGD